MPIDLNSLRIIESASIPKDTALVTSVPEPLHLLPGETVVDALLRLAQESPNRSVLIKNVGG